MSKEENRNKKVKPRVEGELMKKTDDNPLDSWRIFKIMAEFVEGFEMIRKFNKAATFYGSARCGLDDKRYQEASELAAKLSNDGFDVVTGGGPGIMEAANRGAFQSGVGKSIGLNIELPMEQKINPSVHESKAFHYFFTRKVMLAFASDVYIYFPGGFGTLDEFFEMLTLVQTKKINRIPIILYGKDFWEPLVDWFKNSLAEKFKTIDASDTELFVVVDSVDEAYEIISEKVYEYCGKNGTC